MERRAAQRQRSDLRHQADLTHVPAHFPERRRCRTARDLRRWPREVTKKAGSRTKPAFFVALIRENRANFRRGGVKGVGFFAVAS